MAIVALIAARDMRWRLAGRLKAVVAARTTAAHCCVVQKCDDHPTRGYVAVRAFARCHDMRGGLRRGSHQAVWGVAAGARRARRCERATHMAAFASGIRMSTIKCKSGAEMIE